MLRLEVIHQFILPHEAIHALARTISNGAVELLWTNLVFLQVTVKVAWAAEGLGAADVRTGESALERGRSTAGDGRWSVKKIVLCGRQGCGTEHASMISCSNVVRVVAYEGGSGRVIRKRRYGIVMCTWAWEVDLHMSIEALFIRANKVALWSYTNKTDGAVTPPLLAHQKKKKLTRPQHSRRAHDMHQAASWAQIESWIGPWLECVC